MSLLDSLKMQGLTLQADGNNLRINAREPLSKAQLDWLLQNKQKLLDELRGCAEENITALQLYSAVDLDIPLNKEDQVWVDRLINGRSSLERHSLLSEYKDHWLDASSAPNQQEFERDNSGRFTANAWLRTRLH